MSGHALIDAIERGDTATLRKLLSEGADPNEFVATEYEKRTTPLIVAAVSDASGPEVIQILLDAGADLRTGSGRFGTTALWWACGPEGPAKRKVLLDAGADPFESAGNGRTILGEVTRADDLQTFNRLLTMGVDPFPEYERDFQYPYFVAVEEGADSILKRYLDLGADPNASNRDGTPLLHLASSPETVSILVRAGADIEARDELGRTTLAKSFGTWQPADEILPLVSTLTELGANVNALMESGISTLMRAVRGQVEVVEFLIAQGADPLHLSDYGSNALHEMVDVFYKDNPYETHDLGPIVQFLMRMGVDLEGRESSGMTPLLIAVSTGDTPTARTFIEQGAEVNARVQHPGAKSGSTALMLASPWDEAVAMLLAAGADPCFADEGGRTALDHAREALLKNENPPKLRERFPEHSGFLQWEANNLILRKEERERLLRSIALLEKAVSLPTSRNDV